MLEPVSALTVGVAALYALSRPASAVSSEAGQVRAYAEQIVGSVESSAALFGGRMGVMAALRALADSHGQAGWDGRAAAPVGRAAIDLALDFVRALPDDCEMPEVGVDPDGAVSLDWLPSRQRMISISFTGSSNRLAYAWLDGTDRGNGVARFDRQAVPRRLMDAITAAIETADGAAIRVS
jgi:hypothetical protein